MKAALLVFAAALPLLLAPACGGTVFSGGTNGADGGGGGGGGGGGSGSGCPSSMPSPGGACSPTGLECEYGTSNGRCNNPIIDCDSGEWKTPAPTPGPFCPAPSNDCPASKSDVPEGQACGDTEKICEYPDGRCACSDQVSGPVEINPDGGLLPKLWRCESPAPGCPAERPRVGSSCSQVGQTCDYGSCTIPDGTMIQCDASNRWEFANFACAD